MLSARGEGERRSRGAKDTKRGEEKQTTHQAPKKKHIPRDTNTNTKKGWVRCCRLGARGSRGAEEQRSQQHQPRGNKRKIYNNKIINKKRSHQKKNNKIKTCWHLTPTKKKIKKKTVKYYISLIYYKTLHYKKVLYINLMWYVAIWQN